MTTRTAAGTVEILRDRVYPFNPDDPAGEGAMVTVSPGAYPLHFDGTAYWWSMTGRVTDPGGFKSLGDGVFILKSDDPSGPEVSFTSKRFIPEAFADLLAEDGFTEGHPEQRLRVVLHDAAVQS